MELQNAAQRVVRYGEGLMYLRDLGLDTSQGRFEDPGR